jgi:large subunit ribosomal protein L3
MCKGLIGKKLGMTGVYSPDGKYVPVTVVEVGPCIVTQIKTAEIDGYQALQLGFGNQKESRTNKPLAGHCKKSGDQFFKFFREFEVDNPSEYTVGQVLTLDMFKAGERVEVSGTTKGRGFAGTIKRHGFRRGPKTHGSRNYRLPGSIGCSAWPSKVFKGKKMPGHYGVERKTVRNLKIVDVRADENVILIKGAVPGSKSGIIEIKKPKFTK